MRIRTVLLLAFLLSTIIPTVIFGWWSYNQSLKREFSEVTDRHLLLAQNLGAALKRYNADLVATVEAISAELMAGKTHSGFGALMTTLRITCVLIVDAPSGAIVARIDANPVTTSGTLPGMLLQTARTTVEPGKTTFSHVLAGGKHGNILLGVRQYGDQLAVALVNRFHSAKGAMRRLWTRPATSWPIPWLTGWLREKTWPGYRQSAA